ncbi:MAG TPA: alcohol dehydrogenase catalytic domain-containing protein [Longimicrobiales bacterium]|nr:alcohol dehydrogenase catalytic domain-containing protein [Longimicrobiales bacterium]
MKAAIFSQHGDPDVIRIADVPRPEPGHGEVRLRVAAAGMNHLDLWVRRGLPIETTMPHIGGSDVAGVVDAAGQGVADDWLGARVVADPSISCGVCEWCTRGEEPLCVDYRILGEHTNGGFAEYVTVPARNLLRIPDGYPVETAAAAPLGFLTAWRGLVTRGRLTAGESVLVTGASGGVATAAIQIARYLGARVFAVTTGENIERVRSLGADVVYDREQVDYSREIWRDTQKRGVDLIFDSVGEQTWQQNVRAAARAGRIVVYGGTTGPRLETDARVLFWKQLEIIGTTMSSRAEFRAVMDLVFSGELDPVVDVVWDLDRAREAHERLEAGRQFGRIVLRPPSQVS